MDLTMLKLVWNITHAVLMLLSFVFAIGLEVYAIRLVLFSDGPVQWDKATFMVAAGTSITLAYYHYLGRAAS